LTKLLAAKCFVGRYISDKVSYKIIHASVLLKDEYLELINYNKFIQIMLGHFLSPVSTLSADSESNEGKKRKYSTILNELPIHKNSDMTLNWHRLKEP
jgi:hypothetical protein